MVVDWVGVAIRVEGIEIVTLIVEVEEEAAVVVYFVVEAVVYFEDVVVLECILI